MCLSTGKYTKSYRVLSHIQNFWLFHEFILAYFYISQVVFTSDFSPNYRKLDLKIDSSAKRLSMQQCFPNLQHVPNPLMIFLPKFTRQIIRSREIQNAVDVTSKCN